MAVPKKASKTVTVKFVMDCSIPASDQILDPAGLEKYFIDRIKVDGRTGNFENRSNKEEKLVEVSRDSRDGNKVYVNAVLPFKKRYLKYLTKKYLKKQQIRDYLRVISANPTTYTLKYFPGKNGEEGV